jgi:tRNA 2-selenouridine synthase
MAETLITLPEFFELRKKLPLIDARSEGEFAQSQIPNAINIPILNDEERVVVGTLYKEKGNEVATLKGFELVGPRFHEIQKSALAQFPDKKILIYCWRGGMRSQILSWLLTMVGFEVYRLQGGYKTYRTYSFDLVRNTTLNLIVLAGRTGTGKTLLLKSLKNKGEQILDLEGIANHKGSSFGAIGQAPQPTVEQFENLLAEAVMKLDPGQPTWIENESRKIGRLILPELFYQQMLEAPLIDIHRTDAERVKLIADEYAILPKDELIQAVLRLKKKLGGLRTSQAIEAIVDGNHANWIANLLIYYDKAYDFDLEKHESKNTISLNLEEISESEALNQLINARNELTTKASHSTD